MVFNQLSVLVLQLLNLGVETRTLLPQIVSLLHQALFIESKLLQFGSLKCGQARVRRR
jgi:hypothetical protein